VGVTGIAGVAVARQLVAAGWKVWGLSRRASDHVPKPVISVQVDLLDQAAVITALKTVVPEYVFITTWVKKNSEAENIAVNTATLRNLFAGLEQNPGKLRHVSIVTGLKHYLGPFEAYGKGVRAETPFREIEPRLPVPNFYYSQEDEIFAAAKRSGFTWSVHRSHTMWGFALGNAMNMALTISVYAAICKELAKPFVFPGSVETWNFATDVTDSDLLAEQMIWSSTHTEGANQAFNTVNGDLFRWRWLWPQIAKHFGLEWSGPTEQRQSLEKMMQECNAGEVWKRVAAKEKLAEENVEALASWWHTDLDLGRNFEVYADMTKSREAGFFNFRATPKSFLEKVEQYRQANIIPK